jgi:tripartite-type tricarboxylate transporter receptor subunit TctC
MAGGLQKELGTSVEILNKPGAGAQIGLTQLVQSKPDGYTLSYTVLPTVATQYLQPDRQAVYTRASFAPIALHFYVPVVIAVQASSPLQSIKDLVEAAKKSGPIVKISDGGLGATGHLAVLLLQKTIGVKFASVHFDSGGPATTALLGGHVDALSGAVSDVAPHVASGKLRVLGIADDQPSKFLPGAPTMKEQGYDVLVSSSTGVVAPAGTPSGVIDIISNAMKRVIMTDEHQKRLSDYGVTPRYLDPAAYSAYWADQEKWIGPVLKDISTG